MTYLNLRPSRMPPLSNINFVHLQRAKAHSGSATIQPQLVHRRIMGAALPQPIQTLPHLHYHLTYNFHIVILPSCNHSGWFSGGWSPCQGIMFLFSTTLLFNYFIWDLPVTSSDYTSQPAHLQIFNSSGFWGANFFLHLQLLQHKTNQHTTFLLWGHQNCFRVFFFFESQHYFQRYSRSSGVLFVVKDGGCCDGQTVTCRLA